MTNISASNASEVKATASVKHGKKSVETTGSIASNYSPIFSVPVYNYDMFIPSNPFSLNIDFSAYGPDGQNNLANNSTFMQGWANAMAALSEGGFSEGGFGGAGGASIASGGFSGGSCSAGGGFTSVG